MNLLEDERNLVRSVTCDERGHVITHNDCVGAFADPVGVSLHSFVNEKFIYSTTPNPDRIIKDETGGGTVTIENGLLKLQTGAAINKSASFRTRRPIPYIGGCGNRLRFTVVLNGSGAGKYREFGAGSIMAAGSKPANGLYFKDDGGNISLNIRKNGTDIVTCAREEWLDPLDGSGRSGIDANAFEHGFPLEIMWPYLGFGDVFVHAIVNGRRYSVCKLPVANLFATPFIDNPTLYPYGYVENTTAVTNTVLSFGSIGGLLEQDFSKAFGVNYDTDIVTKSAITTESPILSVFNPLNAFGGTNNNGIILRLSSYAVSCIGNGSDDSNFRFYVHNAPVTGGSYTDLLAGRSVAQVNTTPTSFTTTGQRRVHIESLDRPNSTMKELKEKNIYLYPGEYLTVTGQSATAFTGNISLGLEEFQ